MKKKLTPALTKLESIAFPRWAHSLGGSARATQHEAMNVYQGIDSARLHASDDPSVSQAVENLVADLEKLLRSRALGTEALLAQSATAFALCRAEITALTNTGRSLE